MLVRLLYFAIVLAVGGLENVLRADDAARPNENGGTGADSSAETRDRGAYLVHHVAMCIECHSPRTEEGELISAKLLTGGRIPFRNPYESRPWATKAPRLAGLPGFDEEEIITLLTQGRRPSGLSPRPPMPSFRLSRADAQAVVTYLKSRAP